MVEQAAAVLRGGVQVELEVVVVMEALVEPVEMEEMLSMEMLKLNQLK